MATGYNPAPPIVPQPNVSQPPAAPPVAAAPAPQPQLQQPPQQQPPPPAPQPTFAELAAREQARQQQLAAAGQQASPQVQPQQPAYQPGYQPQPQQPSVLRSELQRRGYDTSAFADDDQLLAALERSAVEAQSMPQLREMAAYGQRYIQHAADFERFLQTREGQPGAQAAPAPQAAQPQQQKFWEVPTYDPTWETRSKWDPQLGRYVPATQYDSPAAAEGLNNYRNWEVTQLRQVLTKFPELARQSLGLPAEGSISDIVKQQVETMLQQRLAQDQAAHYVQTNRKNLILHDALGNPVRDAFGQEVLSPQGQALVGYANEAKQYGISDPLKIQQYAFARLQERMQLQQAGAGAGSAGPNAAGAAGAGTASGAGAPTNQPPGAPAVMTAAERNNAAKQNFLSRHGNLGAAARVPNQGGAAFNPQTVTDAARVNGQQGNVRFMDYALPEIRKRGLLN